MAMTTGRILKNWKKRITKYGKFKWKMHWFLTIWFLTIIYWYSETDNADVWIKNDLKTLALINLGITHGQFNYVKKARTSKHETSLRMYMSPDPVKQFCTNSCWGWKKAKHDAICNRLHIKDRATRRGWYWNSGRTIIDNIVRFFTNRIRKLYCCNGIAR